ncbi:hypothetical protein [Bacillus sp. NTK034]|uniref:hypothetical protein n=1 Tax=Bacillus sp. NTK034 TaxID=2802176 RepID=UPI001A8E7C0C|nr:hypothetical protein [Bacillus sp. NTK034]MBN8202836.1 hypothetical protein [Bacillus sp. NTK034]
MAFFIINRNHVNIFHYGFMNASTGPVNALILKFFALSNRICALLHHKRTIQQVIRAAASLFRTVSFHNCAKQISFPLTSRKTGTHQGPGPSMII